MWVIFKCLYEPLESMEAQGCAGWFSLEKKQEVVLEMCKNEVQFYTQRAQATAWPLEQTWVHSSGLSYYLAQIGPLFDRGATGRLSARADLGLAWASELLDASARADCSLLMRTCADPEIIFVKEKGWVLEGINGNEKPEYVKGLLIWYCALRNPEFCLASRAPIRF